MVKYSVLHENEQLFASKYRLILPSEEELRAELERDQLQIEDRYCKGYGAQRQKVTANLMTASSA